MSEEQLKAEKLKLLDRVEKEVIDVDDHREYSAKKAGDVVSVASAASMNGLRNRQRQAIDKLRLEL